MARTRRSLDERIEEQEQVVSKAKEHYESAVSYTHLDLDENGERILSLVRRIA